MTKNDLLNQADLTSQFDLISKSVRMYRSHVELLERAVALKQASNPAYTESDYIRETLALQAAIDLGVEVPPTPEILRGRGSSLVDRAAAQLGMTRAEFEQRSIQAMAAQALGADVYGPDITPRRPASGTYKRSSVAPEAITRPRSTPPQGRRKVG